MSNKTTQGRRNRRVGRQYENEFVRWAKDQGIPAERVSRTGSTGTDTIVCDEWHYEVKGRKDGAGFAMLRKWLGANKGLVLRIGGQAGPDMIVLTPEHWRELVLGQRANDLPTPAEVKSYWDRLVAKTLGDQ